MTSSISPQEAVKRISLGDDYSKTELERPIRTCVSVSAKQVMDQVQTSVILDYLRLYRNQRI